MDNKRHFSRIKFDISSVVKVNGCDYETELLDISLKGALMFISSSVPLKLGDDCKIEIHLPSSDIKLQFEATLVHLHEKHYGFVFRREELETLTHLRRLLELNLGNGDKITDELFFLKEKA